MAAPTSRLRRRPAILSILAATNLFKGWRKAGSPAEIDRAIVPEPTGIWVSYLGQIAFGAVAPFRHCRYFPRGFQGVREPPNQFGRDLCRKKRCCWLRH